jgi:hypothetical protein
MTISSPRFPFVGIHSGKVNPVVRLHRVESDVLERYKPTVIEEQENRVPKGSDIVDFLPNPKSDPATIVQEEDQNGDSGQ